ncbi:MAG TPA: cyclodeaminase/cyclohydrolase family protein [Syntrophobacteria bacterium]|nr:cyclodeaminase/cyclohydrolase family protein [Syntrophobacteria bacterium]
MKFADLSVRDFIAALGAGTPTPGGGSAAALCGALGSALAAMVAGLTLGKERYRDGWATMEEVRRAADELGRRFLDLVQEDADAYQGVLASLRLPKATDEEKASRQTALQDALKRAASVPLESLRASERLAHLAKTAVEKGNPSALTDAGAALHLARAAAAIAAANVKVNLADIVDDQFVAECMRELEERVRQAEALVETGNGFVNSLPP